MCSKGMQELNHIKLLFHRHAEKFVKGNHVLRLRTLPQCDVIQALYYQGVIFETTKSTVWIF